LHLTINAEHENGQTERAVSQVFGINQNSQTSAWDTFLSLGLPRNFNTEYIMPCACLMCSIQRAVGASDNWATNPLFWVSHYYAMTST